MTSFCGQLLLRFMIIMTKPELCEKPGCGISQQLQRCSRCKLASYCSRSCQKSDYSQHKMWCQAAAEAQSCDQCANFRQGLYPAILLHISNTTLLGDDTNTRFAWTLHPPFLDKAQKSVASAAMRANPAFDTVVMHGGFAYAGGDMTVPEVRRFFDKCKDPCSICYETQQEIGASASWTICSKCQSKFCPGCCLSIDTLCPMCRVGSIWL